MVIPRTWIRKEGVSHSRILPTRIMGQSCGADDVNICRKQTPSLPIHHSIIQRSAQEQRWEIVNTLPGRWWDGWTHFSCSIHGAVSDMCEECNTCLDRTGRFVVEGQSNPLFVLSVMKTHIPLTDQERIEKSQQDRLSKICTVAGFLTTVEVGQHFITKDTE